jgi:hypothetical protein
MSKKRSSKLFLFSSLLLTACAGFAQVDKKAAPVPVETEVTSLQSEMDKVKPDFENPDTAEQQAVLVEKSVAVLERLFKESMTPSRTELAAHIYVRSYAYDQSNEVALATLKSFKKHQKSIMEIFGRFEREKTYPAEDIRGVLVNLGAARAVIKGGNDRDENEVRTSPKASSEKGTRQPLPANKK